MTGSPRRVVPDQSWRDDAACIGSEPSLWFPKGDARVQAEKEREAKAICRRCSVKAACLADALRWDQWMPYGIRGGKSAEERRQ